MKDADCVKFLQWVLPQLHMQWPGFRKVRGQVCKRINKRLAQLQLTDIAAYQDYLSRQPQEWLQLDQLCRITISRFYRDKFVFTQLAQQVLPSIASRAQMTRGKAVRVWSIGCSSGEEPYTLAILWNHQLAQRFPSVQFSVLATEADSYLLERCQQACYPASTIKDLPKPMCTQAFTQVDNNYCLKPEYKTAVEFVQQDIRKTMPGDQFNLILCRNLVFTYFNEELQQKILRQLHAHLHTGGWLVLGIHEQLPLGFDEFSPVSRRLGFYQKLSQAVCQTQIDK